MKIKQYLLLFFFFLCTTVAFAQQDPPPLAMLKQTSQQMLNALNANKTAMNKNPDVIFRIVNSILLPHVDLENMGQRVVGRTYWNQATSAQREQFKRLFTRQVTQTYSTALKAYQNEQVKFYPMRDYKPNAKYAQVQSEILRSNGQTIPMSYSLINENGTWKVYDFTVASVSIVQSYSAQFASTLQEGGLGTLLIKMRQRYGQ